MNANATCNALLISTGFHSRFGYRDNPLMWARVEINIDGDGIVVDARFPALNVVKFFLRDDRAVEKFFSGASISSGESETIGLQTTMKVIDAGIDDCGWMALSGIIAAAKRKNKMPNAIFEWQRAAPQSMWKMLYDYNPCPYPHAHEFTPQFDARQRAASRLPAA